MRLSRLLAAIGLTLYAVIGLGASPSATEHGESPPDRREAGLTHHSPYAAERDRHITSLSADDISALRRGSGWGLARPAELNGLPGPIHLLELADPLGLDEAQRRAIQRLYDDMKRAAIPAGEALIEREAQLDTLLRSRDVDAASLQAAVDAASDARARLRYVHLAAHLATPALLTDAQRRHYDVLRGYTAVDDPCEQVPPGHDEVMWRRHNDCDS